MATDKLPPGGGGLPLLGETLPALRNMYAYLEGKRQQYGNVFRANLLGKKVVIVSGPTGAAGFQDQDKITREQAHPNHVRKLFGGINMNMFDGTRHANLKALAIQRVAVHPPQIVATLGEASTFAREVATDAEWETPTRSGSATAPLRSA